MDDWWECIEAAVECGRGASESNVPAVAPGLCYGSEVLAALVDRYPVFPTRSIGSRSRRRWAQLKELLGRANSSLGRLTWGFPGEGHQRAAQWVGQRWIWWPRGIPRGRPVAVVSSRLGRPLEKRRRWFAFFRAACRAVDRRDEVLITVPGTATAPFLERCPDLFHLRLLRFELGSDRQSMVQWLDRCLTSLPAAWNGADHVWPAVVSPPLAGAPSGTGPIRDRISTAAADRIIAGTVRTGGRIQELLERRLRDVHDAKARQVTVAVGDGLTGPDVADKLRALGAELKTVNSRGRQPRGATSQFVGNIAAPPVEIRAIDDVNAADFLAHCTRQQMGPWPGQRPQDYLDDLILERPTSDHSALATLRRIVISRRLLATRRTIRGGYLVVCFTAVPLTQLGRLRRFRSHRGRWDFEPYGICIRRHWLERLGAHPVRYGDNSLWERLDAPDRPFFQRCRSGQESQLDWSVEREWRHVGDIDLSIIPADAALLFVPSMVEARGLQPFSPWPVVVTQ